MARYFVDTNVLVYAFDPSDPAKHRTAREVVRILGDDRIGILSAQVLMEFYAVVTRKLKPPMVAGTARRLVEDFVQSWEVTPLDGHTLNEAMRGIRTHGFSSWDSQIWAAARLSRIGIVLSEDFPDGLSADGVRFVNPFRAGFRLEAPDGGEPAPGSG